MPNFIDSNKWFIPYKSSNNICWVNYLKSTKKGNGSKKQPFNKDQVLSKFINRDKSNG